MVTVSCLATILFFGGWLSPFPATATFAWTRFLPTAVLAAASIGLIIDGLRYETLLGMVLLPALGLALGGAAYLVARQSGVEFVQGPFWFLGKVFVFLFFYIWARSTLPRLRYDQLMALGWKLLLPASLVNVILTSLLIVMTKR